jgi:ComF family protein
VWCRACDHSLARLGSRVCDVCGVPLGRGGRCRGCETGSSPLRLRSYAHYQGPLRRALVRLKYTPSVELGAVMGGWLAELMRRHAWGADLIVPVPLSSARRRWRGYNQVTLIARSQAARLGNEVAADALTRIVDTRSQVGLDGFARQRNVQGAFLAHPNLVQGHTVCVVDDLLTTGATLAACAEALLDAGASDVMGVTVARA